MEKIQNALKEKMGVNYPNGMVFTKNKGIIIFYNKEINRAESIFEGSEKQALLELDSFVNHIKNLYS